VRSVTRREVLLGAASLSLAAAGLLSRPLPEPVTLPLGRRASFGAFAAPEPWPSIAPHLALERLVRAPLPTMSWFQSWDNDWLHDQAASASTRPLLIAWQPWHDDRSPVRLSSVVAGDWDRYLERFLRGAAGHPGEVTIRLAHEMNGTWYPWSGNPRRYVGMWRHIVGLGRLIAPRVRWMWCVNSLDVGAHRAEDYWPGAAWVDVVGLDGYNGYGPWTPFGELFTPMHDRVVRLSGLPQWIAEVGSAEGAPGEKAAWLTGLFADRGLTAVERVVFFHQDKEHDWRLDSSEAALTAVRAGLSEARKA
jgi:mannan endo-1,4-beta-mannosidase